MSTEAEESSYDLLRRFQKDDDMEALGELYTRHHEALVKFVVSILGKNHPSVEDVAADVWDQVMKGAAPAQEQAAFTTWLLGIARNLCLTERRGARRRVNSEQKVAVNDTTEDRQAPVPEQADASHVSAEIRKALASLPPEQAKALWLKYVEGKTVPEIADETGAPESTVKKRLRLAAEKLRDMGFGPP